MQLLTRRRLTDLAWLDVLALTAPLINCILIVLSAYVLATITWRLLLPDAVPVLDRSTAAEPAAGAADILSAAAGGFDIDALAGLHLFGEARVAVAAKPAPEPAPETRLDLRLAGIFYSRSAQTPALALIAAGGGVEQRYRVGDEVDNGVHIAEIHADKILLNRGGQLETLTLPRDGDTKSDGINGSGVPASRTAGAARPAAPSRKSAAASDPKAVQVNAGVVARRLRQNARPDSLQDLAFATPHIENGQFAGLKLKPGRKKRMLTQLGLRNGDVLTELNGTRLTDPAQGAVLLQELLSADRIRAKVVRNGAEIPFTFVLNQ